jgi:hypothetical protein
VFTSEFLRKPVNRQHILELFRVGILRLVQQSRWRTLFWLYDEFPGRHLRAAPRAGLLELRNIIEAAARRARIGDHSGWDEIQRIPRDEGDRQTRLSEAVSIITRQLRASFGPEEAQRVFPSALGQGFGQRITMEPNAWAAGVVLHVRALNRLRKGLDPYEDGTRPGAGFRLPNHAVETARQTWSRHLQEGHREVLAVQRYWEQIMPRIWTGVKERIDFGLQYAGVSLPADRFQEGHYQSPAQSVF